MRFLIMRTTIFEVSYSTTATNGTFSASGGIIGPPHHLNWHRVDATPNQREGGIKTTLSWIPVGEPIEVPLYDRALGSDARGSFRILGVRPLTEQIPHMFMEFYDRTGKPIKTPKWCIRVASGPGNPQSDLIRVTALAKRRSTISAVHPTGAPFTLDELNSRVEKKDFEGIYLPQFYWQPTKSSRQYDLFTNVDPKSIDTLQFMRTTSIAVDILGFPLEPRAGSLGYVADNTPDLR